MPGPWEHAIQAPYLPTHRDIKIPEVGKIYSFNEGNSDMWDTNVQEYIKSLKNPDKWAGKPYSARYIGSLVGDFHRTLLYGGIYGYPSDRKNKNGKLRLLYECAPMSFLAEQAGGLGTTGTTRVSRVNWDLGWDSEEKVLSPFMMMTSTRPSLATDPRHCSGRGAPAGAPVLWIQERSRVLGIVHEEINTLVMPSSRFCNTESVVGPPYE